MAERTEARVRNLSADDLDLSAPSAAGGVLQDGVLPGTVPKALPEPLSPNDQLLATAKSLLARYGGVILAGPPGTSKSYFAARLALTLAGSSTRVRFVQFHPSYQYEDFIEGYVPTDEGFRLRPKHLLQMIEDAEGAPDLLFVMVIDELSRGDAARVFGEALTYVEKTKRGLPFHLASGQQISIPDNLVFIATMNPFDRGVDEVDAAFERRFAKIALDPSDQLLLVLLDEAGLPEPYRGRVLGFFRMVNGMARTNPYGALGHTYFLGVANETDLRRLWDHQLRFLFEKAYQLDADSLTRIQQGWRGVLGESSSASTDDSSPPAGAQAAEVVSASGTSE